MISVVKYSKKLGESGFKFLFRKNLIVITQKIDAA